MLLTLVLLQLLFVSFGSIFVQAEDQWRFIVLADWHGAETFSFKLNNEEDANYIKQRDIFTKIKSEYGGELVILPGDTQTGKWYRPWFVSIMKELLGGAHLTVKQAISIGGKKCFGSLKKMFEEAGYDNILVTIGDHEIGGNPWRIGSNKMEAGLDAYRDAFIQQLNLKDDGSFLESRAVGTGAIPSRPIGTPFEGTSFAYVHKNALFITVDAFNQLNRKKSYFERHKGFGGEGIVTCSVRGKHLSWFEGILKQGRRDSSINHIFVQAHIPIMQPVRKSDCSGQFYDGADDSQFWKIMRKYRVDVYFAGEVHANTVTKDTKSDLLQVVSRGNRINNFLSVDVNDSNFTIKAYNEVGEDWKFNGEYEEYGFLSVEKIGKQRNITSSGVLEIVDPFSGPLLQFNFDSNDTYPFHERQIVGMKHNQYQQTLTGTSISIRGQMSTTGMENHGVFTRQYDAQIANLRLDSDDKVSGSSSGVFTDFTRFAIYGIGPMGGGHIISLSISFKTYLDKEQVLVFYGNIFGTGGVKDRLLLTLKNGNPVLRFDTNLKKRSFVKPLEDQNLADNQWHQVAISMPYKSCLYSHVEMYVDGVKVATKSPPDIANKNIFFVTSGKLSVGGFGYTHHKFDEVMSSISNFSGKIDSFWLWGGKSIDESMLSQASK